MIYIRYGNKFPKPSDEAQQARKHCSSTPYSSLYLLPDEVVTTVPAFAPRGTGEVVISVPVRKVLEFRTIPVMDPSAFCLNLPMTGTSSATGAAFPGAAMATVCFATTAFFSTTWAFAIERVPGALKRLKVPERCAAFFSSTTTGALGAGGAALGPPPNRLNVPDPWTLFFASAVTGGFGGGVAGSFALKRERVGEGLRTGTGDGLGTTGAGSGVVACLKKLKVGAGFFTTTTSFGGRVAGALMVRVGDLRAGTGDVFGTACGAGLGEVAWRKLKGCCFGGDFFSTAMGSGGGVGFAVLPGPKNELRASVIAFGAAGISLGTAFATAGTDFGGDLGVGGALENNKRDAVRRNHKTNLVV